MPLSNVVITGTGVVSSIGIGSDAYFQNLLGKQSGIKSLSERTDGGASPGSVTEPRGLWIGGPIIDFEPKAYVRPRKAMKVMCREIQTAFAASQLAATDAGLDAMLPADPQGDLKPADLGTVFGSEMFYGPPLDMQDAVIGCIREDNTIDESVFGSLAMKNIMPLWMLKYLPNMPACHVGIALNAHGPNNTLVQGDVSGPAAMIEAATCIDRGIAKIMLTGASGTRVNTTRLNYRGDLPIAEAIEPLEKSSRPHDPNSTGVVAGEGAATIVLESPEYAKARGAQPLARLVSYGSHFVPSRGMSLPVRTCDSSDANMRGSSDAIRLSIETAMSDAGVSSDQIGLVVCHGMGDPVIDAAEREAIQAAVPDRPVAATIAALGHSGAACGAIDLATAVLSLAQQTIPPTIQPDGNAALVNFSSQPESLGEGHVLCLSHNSEGNAIAMLLASP